MTLFDNIAFGLRRMSIPAGGIAKRVTQAAGLVNCERRQATVIFRAPSTVSSRAANSSTVNPPLSWLPG